MFQKRTNFVDTGTINYDTKEVYVQKSKKLNHYQFSFVFIW